MKVNFDIPPKLNTLSRHEFNWFWTWAAGLVKSLRSLIYNIDDDNIKSVSADKLKGDIDLRNTPISGGVLTITDDSFRLANSDGSQYIELVNNVINIKANIINDNE